MGSGPAGEVTYVDIKQRLARVTAGYAEAAQLARSASEQVAADRDSEQSSDAHSE